MKIIVYLNALDLSLHLPTLEHLLHLCYIQIEAYQGLLRRYCSQERMSNPVMKENYIELVIHKTKHLMTLSLHTLNLLPLAYLLPFSYQTKFLTFSV